MISRLNRSAEIVAVTCGGRSLMTTRRSSLSSRATNTRDMPPPPSSRSRTYLSAKVGLKIGEELGHDERSMQGRGAG